MGSHFLRPLLEFCLYQKGKKRHIRTPGQQSGERHRDEVVKAKVYRYRYAINKNALSRLNTAQEPVPSFFNTPFYQDVTAEYTATSDVEIEMLRSPSQKRDFAYLCVFDNQKWEPIHFAPLKRGKAVLPTWGAISSIFPAIISKEKSNNPAIHSFWMFSGKYIL